MSSALPARKPWPLKWIVVAIVVFIGLYTYLTLHYRKPGRSYLPYEDMKNRANTGRLLAAGYRRVELATQQPADVVRRANTSLPAPGGLPDGLRATLVSLPLLPLEIVEVHAPANADAAEPYVIQFRCLTPDDKQQLGGTELYVHADELVITPNFERLAGGLQARTRENIVTVTIPAGTLKAGTYHVTLVGERMSRAWMLRVR